MTTAADEDDNKDKTAIEHNSKSISKSLIVLIIIVLSFGIALAVLFFGTILLFGLTAPFFEVVSDSMIPTLQINDTIIVRQIPFSDLKIGDIIVFSSPYNSSQIVVHRIIDRFEIVNDTTIIRTQGDNNTFSIFGVDYPIREHNYIGKVVYHISNIDLLFHILRPPIIQLIILATISVIVGNILYKVFNRISQRKRGLKQH
jgi:signal peptidase I